MFRFTQEPSLGSQSQYLAKIYANTDNAHIDKHSGTIRVILARH